MRSVLGVATGLVFLLSTSTACFADFQYQETSKITGGAAAGMTKFIGVFSKEARQATQGSNSTISIKGNRMRMEDSLGKVEIIDLNGRRFIHLDLKNRTYSVMTFEEMRTQIEQAKKKAAEQQVKRGKAQPNPHGQQQQRSQSTENPVSKGLGSLFGKKKKDEDAQQGSDSNAPRTSNGSLMDMTIEVTSVSNSALDSSLFEIPAGFKQIESKGIGR